MAIAIPDRSSIQSGMQVEINPQRDRTRKQLVIGIIKDILTKTDKHPHGILVELESGEKGRVKKIVSSSDVPVNDIEGTANLNSTTDFVFFINADSKAEAKKICDNLPFAKKH